MDGLEGRCLCGGVTVRLPAPTTEIGVCHCAMCRRWGGGPWMALQAPGSIVTGETLRVYRSSLFAERGFCRTCGSHIFHRPRRGPELAISVGLFAAGHFHVTREIFFDSKPAFYSFAAESEKRSSVSMAREWLPRLMRRWLVNRSDE